MDLFEPQSVELIDSMGNDLTVSNVARVSFNKWKDEFDDADSKLIGYLARHNHWTPFSHVQYTVRITCPIFVARQWFKHMIGITRNEVSRRYVDEAPTFYMPESFRERPDNMKQGSIDSPIQNDVYWRTTVYSQSCLKARNDYMAAREAGICPEQARMMLPQSMMTTFIETGSLQAAARIAHLRLDSHAQKEIQDLATLFVGQLKDIAPVSWAALTETNK